MVPGTATWLMSSCMQPPAAHPMREWHQRGQHAAHNQHLGCTMRSMARVHMFSSATSASRRHERAHLCVRPSATMREPESASSMAASRVVGLLTTAAMSCDVLAHAHTNRSQPMLANRLSLEVGWGIPMYVVGHTVLPPLNASLHTNNICAQYCSHAT